MPNKEKSVKTMPKSNGNACSVNDATVDVIETDVKKDSNNKKRDKHKNKDAIKANNNVNTANTNENGIDSELNNDNDEIRAVSEELLKRLQCNGTSISVRKADENPTQQISANQGDNCLKTGQSDRSKGLQKSKPLNNNNNSKAHNKNCPNQSKSATDVNTSSNNVESSSDVKQNVQCNGTHMTSTENHVTDSLTRSPADQSSGNEPKAIISPDQTEATMTSKEILFETPSCNEQHSHSNLPSTSMSISNESILSSLPRTALSVKSIKTTTVEVTFKEYENEHQMPDIMRVIQRELSEPYSIYTYRYFIHNWPKLCFLAMDGDNCIGAIVCKLDIHRQMTKRGYIAMLAVDAAYRKLKVGTTLVQKAIEAMLEHNADEVVLETEITNIPALRLYENLGFARDKRLFDYYLNGVDALRLKLWFK